MQSDGDEERDFASPAAESCAARVVRQTREREREREEVVLRD